MKKTFYLAAAAALLMASTNAQAGNGISFEINGQKIHVDAPRNCSSLSCLSVSNNGSAVNLKNINLKGKQSSDDDEDVATTSAPAKAQPAPAPAPLPVANNPPPPPAPAPVVSNVAPPAPPAPVASSGTRERISGLPATTSDARAPATTTAVAPVAPPPAPVASTAPPVQEAAPPAAAPTTPVGLWQTADNKGNVRIEQCGANLCGYSEHTNEKILINMKPSDSKWTGRIHDPDSGSNYDSTIAMKGPNILKVQGCAFGGLFCGGQTWKRVS